MLLIFFVLRLLLAWMGPVPPAPRFEAQILDDQVAIGYGLALGDVDGDGKTDILLADKKQFVWYRNGDWQRFVLAENLTESDNVCLAAQDLDGDGKVEVAVGAQWNPGETADTTKSGAVFYLLRPQDPTQRWTALPLHHEPTVHRMRWVKSPAGIPYLVVLPLHGRGNRGGEGAGVKVLAYRFPQNPRDPWPRLTLDEAMHLTHNFDVVETRSPAQTTLYVAGREGVRQVNFTDAFRGTATALAGLDKGAGEVRAGRLGRVPFLATVEPMHGTAVAVYRLGAKAPRQVLDENLKEAHGLAVADLLGLGRDQVLVGWRQPNADNKVGIKLYVPADAGGTKWQAHWIDDNGMATEDLQVADLNGDGKIDIVAAGRATKNLKIYWNQSR